MQGATHKHEHTRATAVLLMGGEAQEANSSVITYDAEADTWGTAPPLPSPRSGCCAATMGGAIYLWDSDGSFQYTNAEWSEVAGEVRALVACGTLRLG